MCTTDIFPFVNPDGSKFESRKVHRCSASRHGQPCQPEVFKHATRRTDSNARIPSTEMPPSPRYTPRTSTPVYQSGTESERSNKSSSSKKRRSGIYVNGTKVLNLNGHSRRHSRNERIVIVDSPPTPRTPPQSFNYPHTAPPSPNMSGPLYNIVDASPMRESLRPIIVDERPRPQHVKIEVVDGKSHRRHHSNSSHNSSNSDSERRRRRDEEERAQEEVRRQRMRARIQRANEEIEARQPVPYPIRRSSTYVRPGVEVTVPLGHSREQELVDAVRQLNIERSNMLDDEAAQRERLRERQMPRRRATVGPGHRRHRVMYDDGTYRWE